MELIDTDALTELSSMLDSLNVSRDASMSSSNSTLYGTSLEGSSIWSAGSSGSSAHNSPEISGYGSPPANGSFDRSNLWSPNFHNASENSSYSGLCGSPSDKQPSEGANGSNIWSPSSPTNNLSYSYPSSPVLGPPPGLPPLSNKNNSSHMPLSTKQTLQCLSFIRELQEQSQNNNQWDSNKTNEAETLTNALQQHLFAHLLKQQQSQTVSTPITSFSTGGSNGYSNGNGHNNYGNYKHNNHEITVPRPVRFLRENTCGEAKCTWTGQLPPRNHKSPVYSCKVFLGGVPFEVTMASLLRTFRAYGNVKVEWPGKEDNPPDPKGYAYLIYENERQVKALLQNCIYQYGKEGNWYYKISSKRMRFNSKDVQVIPWALCDSNYVRCQTTKLDPQKTIFVGALHGMINAEGLAVIMQQLFGGVIYAGIDTDRNKYPIGSARVTFNNHNSYMKAVSAAFVEIRTSKFTKKVQVDPYLEDATCSVCALQQGPYFCRDLSCFRYFCRTCFEIQHSAEPFQAHRPLMRNASRQRTHTQHE